MKTKSPDPAIEEIKTQVNYAAFLLTRWVQQQNPPQDILEALSTLETFCAVGLRVCEKANPKQVRAAALATEIAKHLSQLEST